MNVVRSRARLRLQYAGPRLAELVPGKLYPTARVRMRNQFILNRYKVIHSMRCESLHRIQPGRAVPVPE
jgi:hypothetical protein